MALGSTILLLPFTHRADTTFTINNTTADAFLATGSPGNPVGADLTSLNFGGAGTLAIAPASSLKGRFDSIIKFNFAGAVSQFNTIYGSGNWQINGLTLSLASNFGVQSVQPGNNIFNTINAGDFGLDWLGYDSWTEGNGGGAGAANGAVSFSSMPTLYSAGSAALGVYSYTPPGNNVYLNYDLPLDASLVADAAAGGDVSLYFFAADNQAGYLFNSRSFANNRPSFAITAGLVPEPGGGALLAVSLGGWMMARRKKI